MDGLSQKIKEIEKRLAEIAAERTALEGELISLQRQFRKQSENMFSPEEKIAIFRRLFHGRQDVYPRRFESRKSGKSGYQPACANEWRRGICNKPKIKCGVCSSRQYLPVTAQTVEMHLRGDDGFGHDFTMGVYPLLENDSCRFLAVDFDKKEFERDATAFLETCRHYKIPAALERSRSGNGAHIWIFFSEEVPARQARRMGCFLLTETMEHCPELGFDSYDRFFPNQDSMPSGGFGNLIALPLQAKPRRAGNSVFLDEDFQPHSDQWKYLSGLTAMSCEEVDSYANRAAETGRITGVKMPVMEDDTEPPWEQPPSRQKKTENLQAGLTEVIDIVIENQFYFRKSQLTPRLHTALLRLAAFQNPEFYRCQAMRMPVYDKPRIICCAEEFPEYIGLPRGCADDIAKLLIENKIRYQVQDRRFTGIRHPYSFTGVLRREQERAAEALLKYDLGVLSASTAFGKTVVAIHLLAKRSVSTLILVHRVQLLNQWKSRLTKFLTISQEQIGFIGSGKRNATKIIDVATIQSLVKKGVVDDIVADYGMVIVDECHHLSAFSFEAVIRQCKSRYVLGLSATLTRKDGHHPIIFMQCGPVRYQVDDRHQARERPFDHRVVARETATVLPEALRAKERIAIHEVYDLLIRDEHRNAMIVADVLDALKCGRSPVVITERKEHLSCLEEKFAGVENLFVLRGGMKRKTFEQTLWQLQQVPDSSPRLLLATGRFLGEGFDDSRLDTLFLTMPISWRGTLAQYAGRLHRLYERKTEVVIYDYVDRKIRMTEKMFERRQKGYRTIGYRISDENELSFSDGCIQPSNDA